MTLHVLRRLFVTLFYAAIGGLSTQFSNWFSEPEHFNFFPPATPSGLFSFACPPHPENYHKFDDEASFLLTTMSSTEHFPSPATQQAIPSSSAPLPPSSDPDRPTAKGGGTSKWSHPGVVDLSVFNILNIFHCRWFLSRANNLLANAISAQKAEDGNIFWVEFSPPFHSHLVKCAVALVPHPVHVVKRVMFVFILELLNGDSTSAFFNLQKGSCKANNAQKEKKCLAWKQSCTAKCEWDHKAVKAAKLPMREWQCEVCGCKFNSRKTASKHKCSRPKGEDMRKEVGVVMATQAAPTSMLNKPTATITLHVPPTPSNSNPQPMVTGDSWEDKPPSFFPIPMWGQGKKLFANHNSDVRKLCHDTTDRGWT